MSEHSNESWQKAVDLKLDRILNDVDFIKNRTATYLGRDEVLTYLADDTPIFVNSNDFGCPLNFINGGLYEEDYFKVFLSFRESNLPMLDIGANLGVYSIRMAPYMRNSKIHAFEPIPRIRNLFSRSVFLNGYSSQIDIHPYAVSDKSGDATLSVPLEHAGGASLEANLGESEGIQVKMVSLDEYFPADFKCGLVKIDVEGHELHVLRGMRGILHRSPKAVVMFEKLAAFSGIEASVNEFFTSLEWKIYAINGRTLVPMSADSFEKSSGYFIATGSDRVVDFDRDQFTIFPRDLNVLQGVVEESGIEVDPKNSVGNVLFHGPYWWLPRSYYRFEINGKWSSGFKIEICEKFGFKVGEFELEEGKSFYEFPVSRDLTKFEIVLRPTVTNAEVINIKSICVRRIG